MFNYFFGFFQSEQNYPLNIERKEEVKKLVDDLLLTTVNRMAERIENESSDSSYENNEIEEVDEVEEVDEIDKVDEVDEVIKKEKNIEETNNESNILEIFNMGISDKPKVQEVPPTFEEALNTMIPNATEIMNESSDSSESVESIHVKDENNLMKLEDVNIVSKELDVIEDHLFNESKEDYTQTEETKKESIACGVNEESSDFEFEGESDNETEEENKSNDDDYEYVDTCYLLNSIRRDIGRLCYQNKETVLGITFIALNLITFMYFLI